MLEIEGADKDKVSSWGRWAQSTKGIFYDAKSSLHNLPVQMLLAGWGNDYKKEFFLGRSTAEVPSGGFDKFVTYLRPSLVAAERKVAKLLKELDALPRKEKQWQCNQKARTRLTDIRNSVHAERRLIYVFLYGLPLLLDMYTAERLVVVRGSQKVRTLLQDASYKEYSTLVRSADKKALDRIELARLPLEERLAAQQEARFTHLHEMFAKVQAGTDTTACDVDEPEPKKQRTGVASLPESTVVATKSGLLHFADLHTVERHRGLGWKELSKQSRTIYNKRRHQRIRLLMDVSHALSADAACRVYQHVKQKGEFSLAELRDVVNHAELVPDSRARGGPTASRKDTDNMLRAKNKPLVTKRQILAWREEALQVELERR